MVWAQQGFLGIFCFGSCCGLGVLERLQRLGETRCWGSLGWETECDTERETQGEGQLVVSRACEVDYFGANLSLE
jgi:hypothetical protein